MRLEWEIRSDPPTRIEGHTIEFRAEEIGEEDSRTNYEYLNQGACNSQQRQSHNFPATMMISKLPNRDRNEQYWKPISLFHDDQANETNQELYQTAISILESWPRALESREPCTEILPHLRQGSYNAKGRESSQRV